MGRFINADSYASTGQGVLGNNMFAYCNNDPISGYDPSGQYYTDYRQQQIEGSVGAAGMVIVGGFIFIQLLATTQEVVEELVQDLQQIKISVSPPAGEYTVYFLCKAEDPTKKIIYVGRVKTENFSSRMNYHKNMGREYVDSISNLSYEACRAIEQGGMIYYHTINGNSEVNNQIRGISPTNKNRHIYFALVYEMIKKNLYVENSLIPLSFWENLTEEKFLNVAH